MTLLDLVRIPDVFRLLEPDPVCPDEFLRRVLLPHRPIRRHTPHRERHVPERHPFPQRANILRHEPDVEIPDPIQRIHHIDHPKRLLVFPEFEWVFRHDLAFERHRAKHGDESALLPAQVGKSHTIILSGLNTRILSRQRQRTDRVAIR